MESRLEFTGMQIPHRFGLAERDDYGTGGDEQAAD
jgi:hypothetical protein